MAADHSCAGRPLPGGIVYADFEDLTLLLGLRRRHLHRRDHPRRHHHDRRRPRRRHASDDPHASSRPHPALGAGRQRRVHRRHRRRTARPARGAARARRRRGHRHRDAQRLRPTRNDNLGWLDPEARSPGSTWSPGGHRRSRPSARPAVLRHAGSGASFTIVLCAGRRRRADRDRRRDVRVGATAAVVQASAAGAAVPDHRRPTGLDDLRHARRTGARRASTSGRSATTT